MAGPEARQMGKGGRWSNGREVRGELRPATRGVRFTVDMRSGSQEGEWVTTGQTSFPEQENLRKHVG